jgi:carbon-monoxide dehydrogenase small subunit
MVVTALDARLTARSVRGARELGPAEFFKGYLTTALEPDEVLVDVRVPSLDGAGYAVEEFSRRAGDFAVAAVVAIVAIDSHGLVEDVRLALGGVGPTAVRARAAEDVLRGHAPSADRIAAAAAAARDGIDPDSDAFVSAAYRRHVAGVLARRAIARAVARAMGSDAATRPGEPSPRAERARQDLTRLAAGGAAFSADGSGRGGETGHAGRGGAGWVVLRPVRLTINARGRDVGVRPNQTLLEVLRDTLGIFDAKEGCGEGVCGACTVLLDGRPVSSCLVLAPSVGDREIMTVRGIEREGGLHPLQEAFVRHGAVQCGFCTPGMLLTALAFLDRHPDPDREQIRAALEGNLCRCTGYTKIVDAIEAYVSQCRSGTGAGPRG